MRTTLAGSVGGIAGLILLILQFFADKPLAWPLAAVVIAGLFAIAAVGIFARDHAAELTLTPEQRERLREIVAKGTPAKPPAEPS